MKNKQQLVITLPEELADLPVKILRGSARKELLLSVRQADENATSKNHPA